jgi:transcriptional regulator with XRE-family HTH domain
MTSETTSSDAADASARVHALGRALKLSRVAAGLLQSDVALTMGMHATAIGQLERGERAQLPADELVARLDAAVFADGAVLHAAGLTDVPDVDGRYRLVLTLPANFTRVEQQRVEQFVARLEAVLEAERELA